MALAEAAVAGAFGSLDDKAGTIDGRRVGTEEASAWLRAVCVLATLEPAGQAGRQVARAGRLVQLLGDDDSSPPDGEPGGRHRPLAAAGLAALTLAAAQELARAPATRSTRLEQLAGTLADAAAGRARAAASELLSRDGKLGGPAGFEPAAAALAAAAGLLAGKDGVNLESKRLLSAGLAGLPGMASADLQESRGRVPLRSPWPSTAFVSC